MIKTKINARGDMSAIIERDDHDTQRVVFTSL